MIKVGIVGWGYWGPNLGRNIADSSDCRLAAIADHSGERLAQAGRVHPGARLAATGEELVRDPRIDAVAIATPVHTHFDLALAALRAGKHVLVEKPLTRTSEQARILIEESARRNRVLMVDHTYVFSPPVGAIRSLLQADALGRLTYYDSARLNLGIVRNDVNVLWDVASHDLGILDFLIPGTPAAVHATGAGPPGGGLEHLAYLTVDYPDGFIAHVSASWIAPVKIRRVLIGGSRRMLVYDDLAPVNRLTIHECGLAPGPNPGKTAVRREGSSTPELEDTEPLRLMLDHFLSCIADGRPPITDGTAGLRVVRLLEAADRSLRSDGRLVELDREGVPV